LIIQGKNSFLRVKTPHPKGYGTKKAQTEVYATKNKKAQTEVYATKNKKIWHNSQA
jgi:hypothetical protein